MDPPRERDGASQCNSKVIGSRAAAQASTPIFQFGLSSIFIELGSAYRHLRVHLSRNEDFRGTNRYVQQPVHLPYVRGACGGAGSSGGRLVVRPACEQMHVRSACAPGG